MAKMEDKKILWIFPSNITGVLLASVIVTYIVALIWSWVEAKSFSQEHHWLMIVEMLVLALVVGGFVGMFAGNAKQSTLWIAAGFAWLGTIWAMGLATAGAAGPAGGGIDGATLSALQGEAFSTTATSAAIVLGIVAAAAASMASKRKMM